MMSLSKFCSAVALLLGAQAGVVAAPPGPMQSSTSKPVALPAYDCFTYELIPAGQEFFFGSGGQWFYFFAPGLPDAKASGDFREHTLYRLDLLSRKMQKVFAAKLRQIPNALVAIGPGEARGASVLSFRRGTPGCFHGTASVISMSLAAANGAGRVAKPLPVGEYRVVAGDDGARIADLTIGAIKEIDADTFRQRTTQQYHKEHIPIYASSRRNRVIVLERGAENYLRAYTANRPKFDAELLLPAGWKILQQGAQLALAQWHATSKSLAVREIPEWTGAVARDQVFKLGFDGKFDLERASLAVDFKNQVLVAYGSRPDVRRLMRKLLVYHYGSSRLLGTLDLPDDEYAHGVAIDPAGENVFVMLRSIKTEQHTGLKSFNFAKKIWTDY